MATGDVPATTPIGSFTTWFRNAINRVPSPEEHEAVDELIPQGGPEFVEYVVRFSLLIAMSASIAGVRTPGRLGRRRDRSNVGRSADDPDHRGRRGDGHSTQRAAVASARRRRAGHVLAIAVGWLVALIAGGSVVDLNQLPARYRPEPSRPSSISASRLPPAPPPATSSRAVQPPAPSRASVSRSHSSRRWRPSESPRSSASVPTRATHSCSSSRTSQRSSSPPALHLLSPASARTSSGASGPFGPAWRSRW